MDATGALVGLALIASVIARSGQSSAHHDEHMPIVMGNRQTAVALGAAA